MRMRLTVPLFAFALLLLPGALSANTTYLQSEGDTVSTPGHAIVVYYQTDAKASTDVEAAVYRISVQRYVTSNEKSLTERELTPFAQVESTRSKPVKDDTWRREVDFAPLHVGTYALVAKVGDATSISTLDVTTVGLTVANASRGDSVYMPTDVRTFGVYPGATLSLETAQGSSAIPVVAGLARVPAGTGTVVVRARDGSIAFARNESPYASQNGEASDVGIVQSDRPVYRPGDTVYLRAILRRGNIAAYRIPAGPIHLRVRAPDGGDVANRDLAVSAFGTVNAAVRLPEDAVPGSYSASVGTLQRQILVAAYKKPEYEITLANTPEHAIGGTAVPIVIGARYFFGRPAGGMTVHYEALEQPLWYGRWWGPYASYVESAGLWNRQSSTQLGSGDGVTDASGRVAFTLATKPVTADTNVTMTASARDASGRTVTLSRDVLITAASFRIWAAPDDWFGTPGQRTTLRVHVSGYDGDKPVAGVSTRVLVRRTHWDGGKEVDDETSSLVATTGADGEAAIPWTPQHAGSYRFEISAQDGAGRTATSQTYFWVTDDSWMAPIEQPMLVPDKTAVGAGETANILLAIPHPNRDVLLVTTSDRIDEARVVHVAGTSLRVGVSVPSDAASFGVTALLPTENGVESAGTQITVVRPERALYVTISPGKKRYEPGERATFDVRAVDAAGRPQRAEFGLGVVDQAIYAVQAEEAVDPVSVLYGASGYVYGSGTWFRPNNGLVEAGRTSDVYAVNAATRSRAAAPEALKSIAAVKSAPAIRSNFLDTAYWTPSIVTGSDGRATVSFAWPDNLTTWRATGLGVTVDGDVGRGQGDALVTKDFLVRLETPRFLRAGDESTIVGIAQGQANAPDVRLDLDPGALSSLKSLDLTLHLDANQSAAGSWPVNAHGVGSTAVTLSGSDGMRKDAMRVTLPLLAGTAAEHVRDAGDYVRRSSFAVSVPAGYLAGALHLTISPSVLAELVANQRLLDVYPYYCTEQTMSAALPAVFIGRVAAGAHFPMPDDVDPKAIVRHAIARLEQLQHGDGSWGWWENDKGHPFMTAYALYGLAEFRKDGFDVPASVFDRGVDSLVAQLQAANGETLAFWGGSQSGSEWNTRAFMLFSLATAAPARVDVGILRQTSAHASELNPYALAVLGLAEHRLGNDGEARRLLALLDARAIDDGTFRRWAGPTWHYAWEDDPIETTAYALRLEVAMGEDPAKTDRVVNFLRAQRRGNWWYTTKDTAAAIYALSEALPKDASEFEPDENVRVVVDGRTVRSIRVTSPILDAADANVVVAASQVHDGSVVRFERSGKGALYWSSDAIRYVPTNAVKAFDPGTSLFARLCAEPPPFSVERRYSVAHGGAWRVGDEVNVEVTVRASQATQYVAVEDPMPAGVEHVTEQGNAEQDSWSGLQFFDDRTVFFAERLEPGWPLVIRYTLRATTAGHYTAPGPSAYAMYGPPVQALGAQQKVVVEP